MKYKNVAESQMVILGIDLSEDEFPFKGKTSDGILVEVKAPRFLDKHSECVTFDLSHNDGIIIHNNGHEVSLYKINALIPDEKGVLDAIPMTDEEFVDILPYLTEKKGHYGFISCEEVK